MTQCISLPRLDTSEDGYDDCHMTGGTAGKVWNPARLPEYEYRHKYGQMETDDSQRKDRKPEVVPSTPSDDAQRYIWEENTNDDDQAEDVETDFMIESILLNHTFDR